MSEYRFKTYQPMAHQQRALDFLTGKQRAALFMEMGTGKTKVAIDDAVRLYDERKVNLALVVGLESIKSTWEEELEKHCAADYDAHFYDSSRKKAAADWIRKPKGPDKLHWFVMGAESLSAGSAIDYAMEFAKIAPNNLLGIIDESTSIKNRKAARTKAAIALGEHALWRRILTGSPIAKGYEDLYSQFFFLDPDIIGMRNFFVFRNHYCLMGGYQAKQIVGYRDTDRLLAKLKPFTFQVSKKEGLPDLPDKIYEKREVSLTPEQKRLYKSMKEDLIAELDGHEVTVNMALTKLLRLQQITGGYLPVEVEDPINGTLKSVPKALPGRNPKLEELLRLLEDNDGKFIVWCKFIHEIDRLYEELTHAGINAVKAHGKVPQDDRTDARHKFQNDDGVRVYIGQPDGGGIGITLTAASFVVYYSNSFSSIARSQSEDRAHRKGQTKHVTYIDIVCEGTVDAKVIKTLRGKISLGRMVLDVLGGKVALKGDIDAHF